MKPRYVMCYKKPNEEKWHSGAITPYTAEAFNLERLRYMREHGYQYLVEIWDDTLTQKLDEVLYEIND